MSFVGIDIGGTYVKVSALSPGEPGIVLREPIPAFLDVAGAAREIDPAALLAVVDRLIGLVKERVERVHGLLVTGQMAGLAFVDDRGGALAPLVSWQDLRVTDVDAVAARLGDQDLAATGDGIRVGLPLVSLTGLPRPRGAHVTSLLAFVAGAVTGGRAVTVHTTDAASWGLLDVRERTWSSAALAVAGLDVGDLPSVSDAVVPVGYSVALEAPVFCAVGDQQAALLGAGLAEGEVSMNIATGGQVSVLSESALSPAQVRPYFFGRYLHTITHLPSGRRLTSALGSVVGRTPTPADWEWAMGAVADDDPAAGVITAAVEEIVDAFVGAAQRLGPSSRIRFSGGLAQKFTPLQDRIVERLRLPSLVFDGDDAALAGLGTLARTLAA